MALTEKMLQFVETQVEESSRLGFLSLPRPAKSSVNKKTDVLFITQGRVQPAPPTRQAIQLDP